MACDTPNPLTAAMLRRLLLACIALGLAPHAAAENGYERVSQRVACLASEFADGGQSIGSSFFVAPGVLATARHQIEGARRVLVHLPGGAVPARVLAVDKDHDAALIGINAPGPGVLTLNERKPTLGEEVFTVGCPLGLSHTLTRGVISHPDRAIRGQRLIQTDLAINQGNSGGPLVNGRGEVIGVVHGQMKESSGINFAVPAAAVIDLLASRNIDAKTFDSRLTKLWAEASAGADAETRAQRYRDILLLAPWAAEAYYNLGLIRLDQGKLEEAREHFETASLKKAPYPEALNNLGLALYRLGRPGEARDVLVRAISVAPGYALAYLNLGVVYSRGLGDQPSARTSFLKYLELAPNSAQAASVRSWLGK